MNYYFKKNICLYISILIFSAALIAVFTSYVSAAEVTSLHVYSGAGLRKPMNDIGEAFENEYGIQIYYTYAGSAQNLSQLQIAGEGDIYIPGSRHYYEQANKKGLTNYTKDVAYHIPVIAVSKDNPKNINSIEDLTRDDLEIVLGDAKANAIGRLSQKIFSDNGIQKEVNKNVIAQTATVNELVTYMSLNQADASIVWEDNIANSEKIDLVRIAENKNDIKTIPISVLTMTEKETAARMFVDFVASKKAKKIFIKHGFKVIE